MGAVVQPAAVTGNVNYYNAPIVASPAKVVTLPEPLSKSDSRTLVDIGVSTKISKNLWTSLPASWVLTSTTGTVADSTGLIPASAGNNVTGRVTSPTSFNTTLGAQGSIYAKVARTGIAANGNDGGASANNTTTAWWDSVGNTYGAAGGGYPPAVWTVRANGVTRYLSLLVNQTYAVIQDFNGGYQYIQFSLLNPSITSANIDATFAEVLFTWSGTTYYLYVDGALIRTGTLSNGALPADLFYQITIGNGPNGANANLGGCLGPHKIERVQINTQFTVPNASRCLIAVTGDSYTVGAGGFNGDGGAPNVATIASIVAANANGFIDTAIGLLDNAACTSTNGVMRWGRLLQAFAAKQLGVTLPFFAAAKSGYANYFTGYQSASPRSNPIAATPLTVYDDAINAARPAVVIELDSVNNTIQQSIANYISTTDPVGDLKWRYDYMAANNPNLRCILLVEAHSMELVAAAGVSSYSCATPANAGTIAAYFRSQLRAAFYSQRYLAAGRVPVVYVPTYERMAGAAEGATYMWGADPRNTVTTGSAPHGPNGTTPDIHMSPRAFIRLSDLIWEKLKPVLQAVLPTVDADIPYDGGSQSSITPNMAFGATQTYTLSGNATINAPINTPAIGARFRLKLIQDATGTRTVTWNSAYRNAPAWAAGTAAQTAYAEFECVDQATNKWQFVGGSSAFA